MSQVSKIVFAIVKIVKTMVKYKLSKLSQFNPPYDQPGDEFHKDIPAIVSSEVSLPIKSKKLFRRISKI